MQGVCLHAAVVAGCALQKLYAVYAEINLAYVSLKVFLQFYVSI